MDKYGDSVEGLPARETWKSDKNLPQFHFVHHTFNMDCPGTVPVSPWRQELWYSLINRKQVFQVPAAGGMQIYVSKRYQHSFPPSLFKHWALKVLVYWSLLVWISFQYGCQEQVQKYITVRNGKVDPVPKHYPVKCQWGSTGKALQPCISTLVQMSGWPVSRSSHFNSGEKAPSTHWIEGWINLRACLDVMTKIKIPARTGNQTMIIHPAASRFTDWDVQGNDSYLLAPCEAITQLSATPTSLLPAWNVTDSPSNAVCTTA
jgi:hypothetical protein